MLYVSHHAPELKRIATAVVLIQGGRVAAQGGLELLDVGAADMLA
jgi:ABC-type molybdate transport system ATPase subunit